MAEIQIRYVLSDEEREKIEAAGGEFPQVLTISDKSLARFEAQGWVRCNPDGSDYQEAEPDQGEEGTRSQVGLDEGAQPGGE